MSTALPNRVATLANGASVSIERAAGILGHLQSYFDHPNTEWEVVFYLRELCLGRPIEPEQRKALVTEGLLTKDGQLEEDMRAVVLAAVRGEGRSLHITSPFTDTDDRAIAAFIVARDHLTAYLEPEEAARYLEDHQMKAIRAALPFSPQTILDRFKSKGGSRTPPSPPVPPNNWTDKQESRDDPSDLPPMP